MLPCPGIDFLVIDCPGTDTYIGRVAHSWADKLVTPINDSFVDLDVVAHVDGRTGDILRPSVYAEMVWEERKLRAQRDGGSIDWIVMRNRLSNLEDNNKREMGEVLDKLAKRIGFRLAPGFSERVIFRELFLQGLTMLDVFDQSAAASGGKPRMSHVAARQGVRASTYRKHVRAGKHTPRTQLSCHRCTACKVCGRSTCVSQRRAT